MGFLWYTQRRSVKPEGRLRQGALRLTPSTLPV